MVLAGKSVLYISYNGMLDWLGQSQVIPYLKQLRGTGVRFTLLSFERPDAYTREGADACEKLKRELSDSGIEWHWLPYHKTPSLLATSYDVLAGIRYGSRLVRDKRIEMVHARSHVPATMALGLKRRFGVKIIFDIRGLMADEYVDAGHWRKGSIAYRITKHYEGRALAQADGVVTLTERIWPIINQWKELRDRAVVHEVIPCCADLRRFRFSSGAREERRRILGIENRFVVVYSGSIDGWYLTEEMADFFAVLRRRSPDALILWLTQSNRERLEGLMQSRGIGREDYRIVTSSPRDVPAYLAAADVGLAFIKPCFSKLASSPTKYAEYLGCGLPLVINAGIGDSDALVTDYGAGVLINEFTESDYLKAIDQLSGFTNRPELTRDRRRQVSEQLFDLGTVGVERYSRLYRRVMERDQLVV
jgi:glycosyltransferase involved in cell wall biosynthesis